MLNFGCGPVYTPGWHHLDRDPYPHLQPDQVVDITAGGLPYVDGFFGYVHTNHALQMLAESELVPALAELRRVTEPGSTIRIVVPSLSKNIGRYLNPAKEPDLGLIESAGTRSGKFCVFLTWHSTARSLFTPAYLTELLVDAGWRWPAEVEPMTHPLDSRPDESLFMEAKA